MLGLSASVIPLLIYEYGETFSIYLIWMVSLFLSAAIMGMSQPDRAWRWGIAVGICLPVVVILKIIIDLTLNLASHSLFPFEIVLALFFALPSSFAGAYLGALTRKLLIKRRIKKNADSS